MAKNPLDILNKSEGSAPKKEKKRRFADPLANRTRVETGKAAGKYNMAGQYAQKTMRLPPEYLDLIQQISESEGLKVSHVERWIVGMGLKAYFEDGVRPSYQKQVARNVELPSFE